MKHLFAPWRDKYTRDTVRKHKKMTTDECVFCVQIKEDNDQENFIIKRYDHTFVVMNKYPYNAGHVLVLPYAHVANLYDLNQKVQQEMMHVVAHSTKILEEELGAEGINLGANLGKIAGAGIPTHVHMHVLPRWAGDTNFLPTIADTKQISVDMLEMYNKLVEQF